MAAVMVLLILGIILAAFVAVIVVVPAVAAILNSRGGSAALHDARERAAIGEKALRQIRTNDGNGAYLIADIAIAEIDNIYNNDMKELN